MKKIIKANKSDNLLETFLKYYSDEDNYTAYHHMNTVHAILDKYDDSNGTDTVDIPFSKATREDQEKLINLVTPALSIGEPGFAKKLFQDAMRGEYGTDYGEGIVDTFIALVKEGLLDENEFKITD